jgi:hypothetical protein
VNLPGLARIGQRGRRGRAAGEQAGGAPGREGLLPAGLGLGQDLQDLAVLLWFLAIPLGRLLDRRRPAGSDRYLA